MNKYYVQTFSNDETSGMTIGRVTCEAEAEEYLEDDGGCGFHENNVFDSLSDALRYITSHVLFGHLRTLGQEVTYAPSLSEIESNYARGYFSGIKAGIERTTSLLVDTLNLYSNTRTNEE